MTQIDMSAGEYFQTLGLDVWDAWSFFKLLDKDSGGAVEVEEFLMGCLRLRGQATAMDVGKIINDQTWLIKNQGILATLIILYQFVFFILGVVSCVCILSLHVRKIPRLHRSGIEADQRTVVSADRTVCNRWQSNFTWRGILFVFFFFFSFFISILLSCGGLNANDNDNHRNNNENKNTNTSNNSSNNNSNNNNENKQQQKRNHEYNRRHAIATNECTEGGRR